MLMRSMYSYFCVLRSRRVRHRTVKRLCEAMLERENDTVRRARLDCGGPREGASTTACPIV